MHLPSAGYACIGHSRVAIHSGESSSHAEATQLLELRNAHWNLVNEAEQSPDHKLYSQSPSWRASLTAVHSELLQAISDCNDRGPLAEITLVIRSFHPGRALPCSNPTKLAAVLQPAVDQKLLSQEQVNNLTRVAAYGITAPEFRNLQGAAEDLSFGNADDPEHEKVLLDFYFAQAARGRVLIFPPSDEQALNGLPALTICPSFLVFAIGKKPRPILNLSAANDGPNQRMADLEASTAGYTTVPKVSSQIVHTYVDMVLNPEKYDITNVHDIDLALFVADASDAFYRVPIAPELVGIQCARVAGYTIVPMCCTFGWKRSAEEFSHITAAIIAAHKSGLSKVSVLSPEAQKYSTEPGASGEHAADFIIGDLPETHLQSASGHVDDFLAISRVVGNSPAGAASDLLFAITSHLGLDGVSVKKFGESSFWSSLQKVIGAWFDTDTFSVTMPRDKIQQTLDILNSKEFGSGATVFPIDKCSSLRGKLRWALLASKMGDSASLIGIEKQRNVNGSSKRFVHPARHCGESQAMATKKFHNDLIFYKKLMEACLANPAVASCSMLSLLPLDQRLNIPGQSKHLVWLSGDFSKKAQSFGVEGWHASKGYFKKYCVIYHSPSIISSFEEAARGDAKRGEAIVSSVLERFNKFCAEFVFRDFIAGRPCIVLEDNQGSVACINSGYANNIHLQAMQLVSNLRQAVDEAPMEAFYTHTENMSFFDKSSRLDTKFVNRMNADLLSMGLKPWELIECRHITDSLTEWLSTSWEQQFPLFDELLGKLESLSVTAKVAPVSLSVSSLQEERDARWQDRVQAAAHHIPHYMGSFGPMAYSTDHLSHVCSLGFCAPLSWSELRDRNAYLAQKLCYTLFDAFHGGCGATVAAINAGIFVKGGADIATDEINLFENLTGRSSLGDMTTLLCSRMPSAHIWVSCSSCKDWSSLGSGLGSKGKRGGDQFIGQFDAAAAANAKVVVIENVDGVATLDNGMALQLLGERAAEKGYNKFYSKKVVFAMHGDPEHRSRRIIVAFHASVDLKHGWQFPSPSGIRTCAGDVLLPSFLIKKEFWDDRPWYRTNKSWLRSDVGKIFTEGFKYGKDRVGSPTYPARVWHPRGLFPTVLASGNAGLVRWPKLFAMCPVRVAFATWAGSKQTSSKPPGSCIKERRPTPIECLISKGFPDSIPFPSNVAGFRFAGNAVPPAYFESLLVSVCIAMDQAGVDMVMPPKASEYSTNLAVSSIHDLQSESLLGMGTQPGAAEPQSGHHLLHRCRRKQLYNVPVTLEEIRLMSDQLDKITLGRLDPNSLKAADMGWQHWMSFCSRFKKPLFLKSETQEEAAAAAAQAQLFLTYETACFNVKAVSVAQKIWAVGVRHKVSFRPDPFSGNSLVRAVVADAVSLDEPAQQKVPITNTTLEYLVSAIDLHSRPGFTLWTGIRFAIAFLCRVSEWAWQDKYSIRWKHVVFYTLDKTNCKRRVWVNDIQDALSVTEMQVVFFNDKTAKPGESKARTFHAIPDKADSRCIVRDMARLWLISERVSEFHCFSWAADTAGVTRTLINSSLKAAAVATGIPGADVSSHSLRCTGLSRLLAAKPNPMPWELAKKFGRWKSDCALRYFWASADIAQDYAASLWDAQCYVRLRGDGELQCLQDSRS